MEVYLVRHGEAKSEYEDPERPLADKGRSDVSILAEYVATLGLRISKIYHSERLRAKQTAEIFYQKLKPKDGLEQVKALTPYDDIQGALKIIENAEEPIMIVGHLPHLSKLLSALVAGEQNKELVEFDAGGIVCIAKKNEHWLVRWSLNRQTVRS